jgi:anti-sigma factor RsiW
MNAADDNRLEILIGKLLDGELSPRERGLLESEIPMDRHAKELFEQMRVLHECSHGVVTHEVLGRGADPAVIFERAWQQSKQSLWRRGATGGYERQGRRWGARADGHLRFAVGIAAGLLLGLVLRFVPLPLTQTLSNSPSSSQAPVATNFSPETYNASPVAAVPSTRTASSGGAMTLVRQAPDPRLTREGVDWYVYTDRDGNRWLIEGTREGRMRSAAYPDGL